MLPVKYHPQPASALSLLGVAPDSFVHERDTAPAVLRWVAATAGLMLITFLGWASITSTHELAHGDGEVLAGDYPHVVQHLEGGMVAKIFVRNGDYVTAGQPLVQLATLTSAPELAIAEERLVDATLRAARTRALLGETIDWQALAETTNASAASIAQHQAGLTSTQRDHQAARAVLHEQIRQRESRITGLESEYAARQESTVLAQEISAMQQELLRKGLTSRTLYLQRKQEARRAAADADNSRATLVTAREELAEYQQRLAALIEEQHHGYRLALEEANRACHEAVQAVNKRREQTGRLLLKAPVAGTVNALAVHTIGSVVSSGETLLEIVPADADKIIEARLSPKDIGHITTGQPVTITVDSFDSRQLGNLHGILAHVSATTIIDKTGASHYQVRIVPDWEQSSAYKPLLKPGMTVDVAVITGQKTLLNYLLKPLMAARQQAFSER